MSVAVTGVAEQTLVSGDPATISRFVGKRTVYSDEEIEKFCNGRQVLAILFRKAHIFKVPMIMEELMDMGFFARAPQSIVSIPERALPWLEERVRG